MEQTPLTLSREDLYELAWSKPISELAKDFGISDVALAKRCKRLGIPVPGRGYWARLDAGQVPHRPKLPNRKTEWRDQRALSVTPRVEPEAADPMGPELETVRARIGSLSIAPSLSILEALPAAKRTAFRLKHPRRSELSFNRGERSGPIVLIDVTSDTLERALLLADTLLRSAESLGWSFVAPVPSSSSETRVDRDQSAGTDKPKTEPSIGQLLVDGEYVAFWIEERFRDEPREPTAYELAKEKREYAYRAPRKTQVSTGKLRLVRLDTYRTYGEPDRRTWYDRKGVRVEDQLSDVLLGFYEQSLSIKARRADDERKEIERQERERLQREREARQDANAKLVKQLETDAGAWHRARYLRRYVHALRRTIGQGSLRARFRDDIVDFVAWAEQYVNQVDPLHALPRRDEFEKSGAFQYQSDIDRMKSAFARILGSDWENAWKLGKDYTQSHKSERHWCYGERSVFEVRQPDAYDETD
jgi:hypothetical protein